MNQKLGLVFSTCATLLGISAILFGISGFSVSAEQPSMSEDPVIASNLTTVHGDKHVAYVPMGIENGLALIDTVLHTTVDTVDLAQYGCDFPLRARLNPDGTELYVACEYSENVIILDTTDLSLVAVIDLPGTCEQDIAFVQSGQYALASSGRSQCDVVHDIAVIDTASHTIVQYIPTPGYRITSITAHPILPLAYAASYQCCYSGSIMVIDTNTFSIQTMLPFGVITWGVQPSQDGQWVYASDYYGQQGVIKIDAQTNEVVRTNSGMGELFGIQTSPDGSRLFVAGGWSGTVHVLDAVNMSLITTIWVGGRAHEIALTCDGSELYVAQEGSSIPVIDTQTYQVTHNISIPGTNPAYGIAICPPYLAEDVYLLPPEQSLSGERGDTLQFVETLSNYTGSTDTFNIELGGSLWPATLSDVTLGPLEDGEQITFTVDVTIPLDADWGALNSVLVTATSEISPTVYFDTAVLNSHRILPPDLYLPVALHHFSKCPDFFDDFSDPDSGWFIGENGTGQAEYLKGSGEYNVLVKPANYYWILKAPTCDQVSYTVEVDARWSGNSGASYGLVFGVKGDFEQFYSFEVNSDYEEYALYRYGPGGWTEIVPFTSVFRTINPGTLTNHLKATRNGDAITLEVNGTVLGTWFDNTISGAAGSGLIVSSYSDLEEAEGRFDNYKVTGLGSAGSASIAGFDSELSGGSVSDGTYHQIYRQGSWR